MRYITHGACSSNYNTYLSILNGSDRGNCKKGGRYIKHKKGRKCKTQ